MYEETKQSDVYRRRNGFIRDIQNIQKDSIKKRARNQMITALTQAQLSRLIEKTKEAANMQQITLIVKYSNQQYQDALAHLGNLLIDEIVFPQSLQNFQFKPDGHPRWFWLIEVMVEREFCTNSLLQYVVQSVSPLHSKQAVRSALSILYKITTSNLNSPLVLKGQSTFFAVLNSCFREPQVAEIAYLLVYQLIRRSSEHLKDILEIEHLRKKIIEVLQKGSLRVQTSIKSLVCRTISQFLIRKIHFQEFDSIVMSLFLQAKELRISLSVFQMLRQFIIRAPPEHIINILNLGLIVELGSWKNSAVENEKFDDASEIVTIARELNQRRHEIVHLSNGIYRQLQKYCLLTIQKNL